MLLGTRKDISIIDLSDTELQVAADLRRMRRERGRDRIPALGRGESAVIAVAEARGWAAGLDETLARRVISRRSPRIRLRAIRDALRWAVANRLIESSEAQRLNSEMRAKGYKGPAFFWSDE